MTSLQMRAVSAVLRLTRKRRMATVDRARERIAAPKGPADPPAKLRTRHDVSSRQVEGFPCHTVAPRGRPAERAAVYLHGGAYISEISPQHWALISRLVDSGVRAEVPSYGLAPQHTYRDAYPTDPRLSPGNGPLAGLAPTDVYVGPREICLPDVLRLRQRADAEGAELQVTVCEGAVHVYPLVPAPEGRAAAGRIVQSMA